MRLLGFGAVFVLVEGVLSPLDAWTPAPLHFPPCERGVLGLPEHGTQNSQGGWSRVRFHVSQDERRKDYHYSSWFPAIPLGFERFRGNGPVFPDDLYEIWL